ncbi:MAG: Ig-like domain repeat protein [Methanobrevibacter millerae]|uniref:Ig-like domain repeat protein n=1 Tax=Methanobrevibacter millerae TaxID=230361 RepID=A0A8T3VE48_9EURY|nr:Ig-like domain repeat protein [Methanobrevibacter millerae]MBE6504506.1 Ig-like domain repeat protein [Methanobrevibacter millerae]
MFSKKFLMALSVLVIFFYVFGAVSASDDLNATQISTYGDIVYETPFEEAEFNLSTSECASFIIQENGETIYGFRQDSPINGHGVEINAIDWYGYHVLKQEIDDNDNYFCHCIVTEHGWVFGQGGSQYNDSNRAIDQIAATMIQTNNIEASYLAQISKILSPYGYGHFVIKAPDGRYGISFVNTYWTGTLQQGQYLLVPNYYSYYNRGNYKNYNSNPVEAIISLCSHDYSGLNRRNLYIYDYKAKETADGVFYGADVYVTNDNGRNVGLNTAGIVTHFFFKGQYFPASSVPQMPGKIYAGTHIFDSQFFGDSIELLVGKSSVLFGDESTLYYRIKYLSTAKRIVFSFGENVDFVSGIKSHGSFSYDSAQHKLYWDTPAASDNRDILFTIKANAKGNFNVLTSIEGMTKTHNFNYYVTDYGAHLYASDVEKYVGGTQRLTVSLKDNYGVPLIGETVGISINGQYYYRTIGDNGYTSLAINLVPGEYDAVVDYDGTLGKNQTNVKIKVLGTVFGEDIVKYYKNGTQFSASFLDGNGNVLKNSDIEFNINGVFYTRKTNKYGVAKLNINLEPGKYIITSINKLTNDFFANSIVVKPVLVENTDLVKYYRNNSQYTVKVLDGEGNPSAGQKVTFNINGVFYTRTTNENGTAKLNINLEPGQYIITSTYNGASVSNKINVLTRLVSYDLEMNYKDGSVFEAVVLDEIGNPASGENLTFNINGIFYNRITKSDGMARLNINLMPGEYIITSYWNNYVKSNTIKIN